MQIQPALPIAFSHIGQRTINQDVLYPAVHKANEQTQLFIICDGMGGADKGEVASQLLCDGISGYSASMGHPVLDIVHLKTALDQVYDAYTHYLQQHPFVNRMGSTLALLQFHHQGVTVAHIGDSRVYQIRGGKIVFQTKDHKQVNDMVDSGIITRVQAETHPWRNRLSRAVVVNADDQLKPPSPPMPDLTVLTDVRAGDYFFMCTDGVLEHLTDESLEALLAENYPDSERIGTLEAACAGQTKDNYSGYLIGINRVIQMQPEQRLDIAHLV